TPSRPSTRPTGSKARRSSALVRKNSPRKRQGCVHVKAGSRLCDSPAFAEKGSGLASVVGGVVGRKALAEIAEQLQIAHAPGRPRPGERERRADGQRP